MLTLDDHFVDFYDQDFKKIIIIITAKFKQDCANVRFSILITQILAKYNFLIKNTFGALGSIKLYKSVCTLNKVV